MYLERKSFDTKAQIDNEDQGIVHALVSAFGNKDFDGDVLVKGAFTNSLNEAKAKGKYPPGVYMHDMSLPVAKTLDAWEADDGLHVISQFALWKQIGRDTFQDIKNGLITEYSFGFNILKDERKDQARHILDVKLWEWSPVLYGANNATHTVGVKSNSLAGLSFDAHYEHTLAVVSEFTTRMESLKELRESEGRHLSETKRTQLMALKTQIDQLMDAAQPKATQEEIESLLMHCELVLARVNGVI